MLHLKDGHKFNTFGMVARKLENLDWLVSRRLTQTPNWCSDVEMDLHSGICTVDRSGDGLVNIQD